MTDATEHVYLIGSEGSPIVKIGRSIDVPGRLAAIQYMSPLKLTVLWQTKGGAELEAALHRWFKAQRSHGEWFNFPDGDAPAQVVQAIADMAAEKRRAKKARKVRKVWKAPKVPKAPLPSPELNPVSAMHPSTLHEQIADKLRQLIEDGELQPGAQVPTEEALAEQLDVSRNTTRQALQRLEREGLIRSRGGRGGRVVREAKKLTWNMLEDVDDLWAAGVKGEIVHASERDAIRLGVRPGDPVIVRRQMVMIDGKLREIADYEIPAQSRAVT